MNVPLKNLRQILENEREAHQQTTWKQLKLFSFQERTARGICVPRSRFIDIQEEKEFNWFVFEVNEELFIDSNIQKNDFIILEGPHPQSMTEELMGTLDRIELPLIWVKFKKSTPIKTANGKWHLNQLSPESTWERVTYCLDEIEKGIEVKQQPLFHRVFAQKKPLTLKDSPKIKEWHFPYLNESQKNAVRGCLEQDFIALIWGPPGTGKSKTLVEIILQNILLGKKIFLTTPSNTALDHLFSQLQTHNLDLVRIGVQYKISNNVKPLTLDTKTKSHPDYQEGLARRKEAHETIEFIKRKKSRTYIPKHEYIELKQKIRDCYKLAKDLTRRARNQVLGKAQIVGSTHAGASLKNLKRLNFDVVIIDEASQAQYPFTLLPLLVAEKVIMAGDPKQLPPTYLSNTCKQLNMPLTLFDELLQKKSMQKSIFFLDTQYRMSNNIQDWPSKQFYENKLMCGSQNKTINVSDFISAPTAEFGNQSVCFIDTAGTGYEEEYDNQTQSYFNPGENSLLKRFIQSYLNTSFPINNIGIICPYRAQVEHIKKTLDVNIEVDTVDSFQGKEKEIIFISLVRSNTTGEIGFLKDYRRFNVAITRSKRQLVVIGDSATLSCDTLYANWIKWVEENQDYRSAWEWME